MSDEAKRAEPKWDGAPCRECGKAMPTPEKIGEWLHTAIPRAHEFADTMVTDHNRGDVQSYAINVLALVEAYLTSYGHELQGLCGSCSYEKHSKGDDEFHIRAAGRFSKHFPFLGRSR